MERASWIDTRMVNMIFDAVQIVQSGVCKRVDVNKDIKVYACKNIIRIDIKNPNG